MHQYKIHVCDCQVLRQILGTKGTNLRQISMDKNDCFLQKNSSRRQRYIQTLRSFMQREHPHCSAPITQCFRSKRAEIETLSVGRWHQRTPTCVSMDETQRAEMRARSVRILHHSCNCDPHANIFRSRHCFPPRFRGTGLSLVVKHISSFPRSCYSSLSICGEVGLLWYTK